MISIVIIEDEPLAAADLEKMVLKLDEDIVVKAKLASVKECVEFFSKEKVDLAISDIHLADGIAFDMYEHVKIDTPFIFTTAYDQYAIRAFKQNSIDYLLKPIDEEELKSAFGKYKKSGASSGGKDLGEIKEILAAIKANEDQKYQERFIVTLGETIKSVPIDKVAYFFSEDRYTYLVDKEGKQHIINTTLGELEGKLDPNKFFRINRKFTISYHSIVNMVAYSKSRVKVDLNPQPKGDQDLVVSVERSGAFKKWLNR